MRLLETPSAFSDRDAYRILEHELLPSLEEFFEQVDTIEKVEMVARKCNPNRIASVSRTIMEWFNVPIPEPRAKRPIGVIHS